MKLIALPDLHERVDVLKTIENVIRRADLVLLPGDLANGHGAAGAASVITHVRALNPRVLAIPGNWDDEAAVALMTREGINLHRRHVIRDGCAFVGVGGALPSRRPSANRINEQDLAQALREAMNGVDPTLPLVLMCHQPPLNTRTDVAKSNRHVGSLAVREFIERVQPRICFTGHIHEGAGIDRIGRTLILNPGPLWEGWYGTAEINGQHVRARCHRVLLSHVSA